jgi:GNAT superfamily N-acetyltransferase
MPRAGADDAVVEWRAPEPLPPAVHEQLFGGGDRVFAWRQLALWRAGRIRCFSLLMDGRPAAFGVIREWRLHRREYAWLGRPGPILGPAWTDPEHRGKGLHRRLLLHRLHAAATSGAERAYTAAALGNLVSRRNIERLGFRPRGCVAIRRACFRLIVRVRPLDEPASVLPGAAGDARA